MATINGKLTFGLELEAVRLRPAADSALTALGLAIHRDASIKADDGSDLPRTGPDAGVELVTPVLNCEVVGTSDGKKMEVRIEPPTEQFIIDTCNLIQHVNKSCGVHLHLGRPSKDGTKSTWEPEKIRTALIIGKILEPRLYDIVDPSRRNNQHCTAIDDRYTARDFGEFYPVGPVKPIKYDNKKRYTWLNLIETARTGNRSEPGFASSPGLGTIEIRLAGNTADSAYVMSWTRLWLKIAAYLAYVPTSLAINHCCYAGSLDANFSEVAQAYEKIKPTAPSRPSRQNLTPSSDLDINVEMGVDLLSSDPVPPTPVPILPRTTIQRRGRRPQTTSTFSGTATGRISAQIPIVDTRPPADSVHEELRQLQNFFSTQASNTQPPDNGPGQPL